MFHLRIIFLTYEFFLMRWYGSKYYVSLKDCKFQHFFISGHKWTLSVQFSSHGLYKTFHDCCPVHLSSMLVSQQFSCTCKTFSLLSVLLIDHYQCCSDCSLVETLPFSSEKSFYLYTVLFSYNYLCIQIFNLCFHNSFKFCKV